MGSESAEDVARIEKLSFWTPEANIEPISGGISNLNYKVTTPSRAYVVRFADDDPVHHIERKREARIARAAHEAGLSPRVVIAENGVFALEWIEARPMSDADLNDPRQLTRIAELIRRCHQDMPQHVSGPTPGFWPPHMIRVHIAQLSKAGDAFEKRFPDDLKALSSLETIAAPHEIAFCHNDMMAGNILDDGTRLWLIDWEYAGFNAPLYDLANLISNNALGPEVERHLLNAYFSSPPTDEVMRKYTALKAMSALREALWSRVARETSPVSFDYDAYAQQFFDQFDEIVRTL
ncbi:MAG: phosphotransferase [Pseudomonadota bacterium]